MKIGKAIAAGIILWVLMFVIISVFIAFDAYDDPVIKLAGAMMGGFISLALIVWIKPKNIGTALLYGLIWIVIGLVFDLVITWRFNNNIFYTWSLWVGYGLVLIATILGYFSLELDNGSGLDLPEKKPEHHDDIDL